MYLYKMLSARGTRADARRREQLSTDRSNPRAARA
jgi:hypothetical protein